MLYSQSVLSNAENSHGGGDDGGSGEGGGGRSGGEKGDGEEGDGDGGGGGCRGGEAGGGAGGVFIVTGPHLVQTPMVVVIDDSSVTGSSVLSSVDAIVGGASILTSMRAVYSADTHVEQRLICTALPVVFCKSACILKTTAVSCVTFVESSRSASCRRRPPWAMNDDDVSASKWMTVILRSMEPLMLLFTKTEQVAGLRHTAVSVLIAS